MNALDAQSLPNDLFWSDELDWLPVEQSTEYLSEGALVIQQGVKQAGRPITLQGVLKRADLLALRALAAAPNEHVLTFNDATYTVRWRYTDQAITATPFVEYADPGDDDYYNTVLRFLEV